MLTVLFVCGERSADAFAGDLASEIRQKLPTSTVWGMGGDRLRPMCHQWISTTIDTAAVGHWETVQTESRFRKSMTHLKSALTQAKFDLAVIIDFPHRNNTIAGILTRYKIPIATVITPNFWIWKDGNERKRLVGYSQAIITIFPDEYLFYKDHHPCVFYFGHPAFSAYQTPRPTSSRNCISVFPGSRRSEIRRMLKPMLRVCKSLYSKRPELKFLLRPASLELRVEMEKIAIKYPIPIAWTSESIDTVFEQTGLLLTMAGTTTMEAVLHHVPMVIMGGISRVSYWVAKYGLRIQLPFIGMPNICLQRPVVPEFIQRFPIDQITTSIIQCLDNPEIFDHPYTEIKNQLTPTLPWAHAVIQAIFQSMPLSVRSKVDSW